MTPPDPAPLTCEECSREQADDERGWRSYLTTDEEQPAEAVIYCRECAEREFGPARRHRRLQRINSVEHDPEFERL